jgi:predicted RNase H-like HicB family nuclease
MQGYWALVHEENRAFGISFPDVPGCVSAGDTIEAVLTEGREALSAHLAWMKAEGDPIPEPRAYADLQEDPEVTEEADGATWHMIVPRTVQAPRVRVNIMIDPGLLREADEAAEAQGMTRSGLIEAALRARLSVVEGGGLRKGSVIAELAAGALIERDAMAEIADKVAASAAQIVRGTELRVPHKGRASGDKAPRQVRIRGSTANK